MLYYKTYNNAQEGNNISYIKCCAISYNVLNGFEHIIMFYVKEREHNNFILIVTLWAVRIIKAWQYVMLCNVYVCTQMCNQLAGSHFVLLLYICATHI